MITEVAVRIRIGVVIRDELKSIALIEGRGIKQRADRSISSFRMGCFIVSKNMKTFQKIVVIEAAKGQYHPLIQG
jgi:hypothetical protein